MDKDRIDDVNRVIFKYSDFASQSSSHLIFDVEPISIDDIVEDLTFFNITGESDAIIDAKLKEMVKELNELGTDYSIRNMDTGKFYTTIESVGAIKISLENLKTIPKGTYKQIDQWKNVITEYGYCKGYKPLFRPIEGILIEDLEVKEEIIYLFSTPAENMAKLIDYISEKISEINPELKIESVIYK
ncbi:hypothetical protein [uncultured Methanobrevibacter sp.]|uniref:hypothetical protein n=1 Tax=uncultured Methanobrevibacter sp. TaxID=253161 RepID=UPI0026078E08|nr:hypothetical protein [uncultured Methanobrevibacter sp.]